MEPQVPQPGSSPERQFNAAGEQLRPIAPESLPASPERGADSKERVTGVGAGDTGPTVQALPPLPAMPQSSSITTQPQSISGTPAVAADDDLIEKEWVDKAKKIIAETRHDPYLQEREVSKLQADYLQKRYGKTIKRSDGA